jgi:hypothetical protein
VTSAAISEVLEAKQPAGAPAGPRALPGILPMVICPGSVS